MLLTHPHITPLAPLFHAPIPLVLAAIIALFSTILIFTLLQSRHAKDDS